MNKNVLLSDLLRSKRWDLATIKVAQAGSKTAKDGYTLGWTSGGAQVDVTYDKKRTRFVYTVKGYAADGSDMSLEPPKEEKWGLHHSSTGWATIPYENPLSAAMLFDSEEKANAFLYENSYLYRGHAVKKFG